MTITVQFYTLLQPGYSDYIARNCRALSNHVRGVECLNVCHVEESSFPEEAKKILNGRLTAKEKLGTAEQYANGFWNVYVRYYETPDDYTLTGFFQVLVEV